MSGLLSAGYGVFLIPVIILIALAIVLYVVRGYFHKEDSATVNDAFTAYEIANYIKQAKLREQEAWSSAMTIMGDDRELRTVHMDSSFSPKADANAPLSDMQKAFFSFWKIPPNKIPIAQEDANRFIEAYKAKLRNEGYTHRVRRWGRLEVMMGRFCSEHDVPALNQKSIDAGIKSPVLDLLVTQVVDLLEKQVLRWKDIANEDAYQITISQLTKNYPQLQISRSKK